MLVVVPSASLTASLMFVEGVGRLVGRLDDAGVRWDGSVWCGRITKKRENVHWFLGAQSVSTTFV